MEYLIGACLSSWSFWYDHAQCVEKKKSLLRISSQQRKTQNVGLTRADRDYGEENAEVAVWPGEVRAPYGVQGAIVSQPVSAYLGM